MNIQALENNLKALVTHINRDNFIYDLLTVYELPKASVTRLRKGDYNLSKRQCEIWFERVFNRYENDLGGMNVLIDKNLNRIVGQCGILIQKIDGISEFEIGYSIMPDCWGKSYATEAAIKSKECAFERGYAVSLISIIHVDNIRSEKVALKNGMFLDKKSVFREMPVNIFRVNK